MFKPIVALSALVLLAACGTGQAEQTRFLREKSSELGAKGVIMFEMRRKVVESLLDGCLRKKANVEAKITCVRSALGLLD